MTCRFLVLFCVAVTFATNSLLAVNDRETDSLIYLVDHTSIPDNRNKYEILCRIAENSVDADAIITYSDRAIKLAEKLEISLATPTALKGIGYLNSGKLSLALEYFLNAANYYKSEKNYIGLATVYTYISETYNMQENHNNEIFYLKNAISIFRREKDSVNLASALHNLGYANYSMRQYDTALTLFNTTAGIYKKLEYKQLYAYCIGNSGLVYSKKSDLLKAEKNLLEAVSILRDFNDDYAITEYMIEYASVLQHKGENNKALACAIRSYSYAKANNIMEFERDASYRLALIYIALGKYDSACFYQSKYISINDSIKNYTNVQRMADMRTEFEVSKKQVEVDVLEKNRMIQRIIIISLGLILLLAIWLIMLYYTSIKKLRRLTAVLDERRTLLEKQSNELKELNRIKDKFFSVISHDLRGPIGSIGGISHIIKESLEQNNPAMLHEITGYIDQTVFSLTELLENLLNWAQKQQGKISFNEENLNVKAIISDAVGLFTTVALLKNIRINLKLKPEIFIKGDRNSMLMIIRNLLSNALKFTQNGGTVTISTAITAGGMAEIVVSDNGVGIANEKLSGLFEFKENKSTYGTENEKGIGLGLNLVHEFVKMNRGTIEVESTEGKGSKFILRFKV